MPLKDRKKRIEYQKSWRKKRREMMTEKEQRAELDRLAAARREYDRKIKENDPEKYEMKRARDAAWRAKNRERHRKASRDYDLKKHYGEFAEVARMLIDTRGFREGLK